MTGNGNSSGPGSSTPLYKLFWWIVVPLLAVMQAATLYAERRPPADLDQRERFISSCYRGFRSSLSRETMAFIIHPEALRATPEGYRWTGDTMSGNEAGEFVDILLTCEGSPLDPEVDIQMHDFSTDGTSDSR